VVPLNPIPDLEYTPIIIHWVESFQDPEGNPLWTRTDQDPDKLPPQYWMKIHAPSSNRRGFKQNLPDVLKLKIPPDGLVRLKLVPSNRYLPIGRYTVEYYRVGCSIPINVERWIVPAPMQYRNFQFIYLGDPPDLPFDVWQITNVTPGDGWVINYNSLIWNSGVNPPLHGTKYDLEYWPAYTLDQLIEYKPAPSNATPWSHY
jgi:hypothetical protein